jgi:chorismate mutase
MPIPRSNSKHCHALLTWFTGALLLILLAACQSQPALLSEADAAASDALLRTLDQRLAIAPLVAKAKWNSRAPIDDPERESQILDAVVGQAAAAGVERGFARAFFQAQFEASKLIQRHLHEEWRREARPPFADAPDLGAQIRPALDRLTPRIIASLGDVWRITAEPAGKAYFESRAPQLIRGDFGSDVRSVVLQPLLSR